MIIRHSTHKLSNDLDRTGMRYLVQAAHKTAQAHYPYEIVSHTEAYSRYDGTDRSRKDPCENSILLTIEFFSVVFMFLFGVFEHFSRHAVES